MKRYFFTELDSRTDLALEAADILRADRGGEIPGVRVEEATYDGITVTRVQVMNQQGANAIGKAQGNYITIDAPDLKTRNREFQEKVTQRLASELQKIISMTPETTVLVVGLGNWKATPDALGPRVIQNVLVTRHLQDYVPQELKGTLRSVCAIAPGVLGLTGIETGEIIKGIVDRVRPDLVLAVDALAARSIKRIMATIQIADCGINPGSGVGNTRAGISKDTLGVPVIAIGVPTVVHAITIASDTIEILLDQFRGNTQFYHILNEMDSQDKRSLIDEVLTPEVGDLTVTPKEIDVLINDMARIVAGGINAALHPGIQPDEIARYLG